ncbi:BTAD domain-containing putative transcriptional regulator [Actinoplanes sp. NPDC049316]|uniref:AfsR/SARP family transcriptional regulator n=1 Tax=Actinoplanes sp. NPDC049316 TaxID=3154727 RepID=UPI00341E230C
MTAISHNGDHLPIGHGRPQKILAALLLDANGFVSTDRLIDVIWADEPPATARQQIQNSIGMLKSALTTVAGACRIRRRASAYTMQVDESEIDSYVFRQICARAGVEAERGEVARAAEHLEQALDLWSGAALQDVDSTTLAVNAEELEEQRMRACLALLRMRFQQGRHAEMVERLTGWTARHPYHEVLHRALAEALHRSSRNGDAVQVLAELRARLDSELDIGPEAATRELEHRLRGVHGRGAAVQENIGVRELTEALRDVAQQLFIVTRALKELHRPRL